MSRKQQRLHRRQMREEKNRAKRLEGTVAQIATTETISKYSGMEFDEKSEESQLYLEVPPVIEEHITVKRVPA